MKAPPPQGKPALLGPRPKRFPRHKRAARALISTGLVLGLIPVAVSVLFNTDNPVFFITIIFGPMIGILAVLVGLICLSPFEFYRTFGAKDFLVARRRKKRPPLAVCLSTVEDGETISKEWGELEVRGGHLCFSGSHSFFSLPAGPVDAAEGLLETRVTDRSVVLFVHARPVASLVFDPMENPTGGDAIEILLTYWRSAANDGTQEVRLPCLLAPRKQSPVRKNRLLEYGVVSLVLLVVLTIAPPMLQGLVGAFYSLSRFSSLYTVIGAMLLVGLAALWAALQVGRVIGRFRARLRQTEQTARTRQAYVLSEGAYPELSILSAPTEGDAMPGQMTQTHGP